MCLLPACCAPAPAEGSPRHRAQLLTQSLTPNEDESLSEEGSQLQSQFQSQSQSEDGLSAEQERPQGGSTLGLQWHGRVAEFQDELQEVTPTPVPTPLLFVSPPLICPPLPCIDPVGVKSC